MLPATYRIKLFNTLVVNASLPRFKLYPIPCQPEADFEANSASTKTCTTGLKADHGQPILLCQQRQHYRFWPEKQKESRKEKASGQCWHCQPQLSPVTDDEMFFPSHRHIQTNTTSEQPVFGEG